MGVSIVRYYTDDSRGTFQCEQYARQLVSFQGMKYKGRSGYRNVTPTDIDGFIQLDENNCFIFFELKRDGDPPTGQGSALRSLVDAIDKGGAESVLLIAHHDEASENIIVAKDSIVDQIYWRGRMVPGSGKTLGTVIDEYIEFLEEEERRKNEARRASKEAHQKYIRYALGGGNAT